MDLELAIDQVHDPVVGNAGPGIVGILIVRSFRKSRSLISTTRRAVEG